MSKQPGFTVKQKTAAGNPAAAFSLSSLSSLTDFWAYLPTHQYLYEPCNVLWVAASIDSHFPPQPVLDSNGVPRRHAGKIVTLKASKWLDQNRHINQLTWAPGEPQLIKDRLADKGGWKKHAGARCLNQYQPPQIKPGVAHKAKRWIKHLRRIYPDDYKRIVLFLAHRVQRPGEKINYALVMIGAPGIGKDTLLEAVKHAVGHWNWHSVTPLQLLGRTTEFHKSVVLLVSEARDFGESGRVDRFGFYDHCKTLLATPPTTIRVNEKYVREYYIDNVIGMVITTNYRDALYLPYDDRRHDVAASASKTGEFDAEYWRSMWHWYQHEDGFAHVAAYLRAIDLSAFDPKAAPVKTEAFLAMADRSCAPEEAELAEAIDALKNPPALTVAMLASVPGGGSFDWLLDPKVRRSIPHWLERCGYLAYRNAMSKPGLWRVKGGKQMMIYVRSELSAADKHAAAKALV